MPPGFDINPTLKALFCTHFLSCSIWMSWGINLFIYAILDIKPIVTQKLGWFGVVMCPPEKVFTARAADCTVIPIAFDTLWRYSKHFRKIKKNYSILRVLTLFI